MGCTASAATTNYAQPTTEQQHFQVYAAVKKRACAPSALKEDGYDVGLRVRDNVSGQYSLYIGTSRKTGEKVTLKEYFLNKNIPDLETRIVQEVAILSRLSGYAGFPSLKELFVIEGQSLFVVTDYIDTFRLKNFVDIRTHVTNLSLTEVRNIFKTLLTIVGRAQEQRIALCNLSLDSIMALKKMRRPSKDLTNVPVEFDICITDLSQAIGIGSVHNLTEHPLFDWNSQLAFCSPEILLKQTASPSSDIWSLGVILFALLSGELPFYIEDLMDRARLMEKIKSGEYTMSSLPWNTMRKDIKLLVQSMLITDPTLRANIAELRRNEWVVNG